MRIKVAALTGRALRYAVAMASDMSFYKLEHAAELDSHYWLLMPDGRLMHYEEDHQASYYSRNRQFCKTEFRPDEDPSFSDPIIDEWHISLVWNGSCWIASLYDYAAHNWFMRQTHPTNRRIAALRTFVARKLGHEVEIPDGIPMSD